MGPHSTFTKRVFNGPRQSLATMLAVWLSMAAWVQAEEPPELVWSRVIDTGSSEDDYVNALAVDSQGNVAIVGETDGALTGSSFGVIDAYIAAYNPQGQRQWVRQFGSSLTYTKLKDVAAGPADEWLIAGSARYKIGGTYYGQGDVYARRYSSTGTLNWTAQLGTISDDDGRAIAVSGSSVYVAGDTYGALEGTNAGGNDAFVARYSNNLNAAGHWWTAQNGTDDWDIVYDVAYDRGRVFVAGETFGNFNGPNIELTDAFLLLYDSEGNFEWARQYGNASEPQTAYAVAADGQNAIYIAGSTFVKESWAAGGSPDAFLAKYDLNGNFQWQRYFATDVWDVHTSLATDAAGNIYVSGYTGEQLFTPNEASALVLKYSPSGDLLWQKEFDVGVVNRTTDIAVSADGKRIWISGNSWNSGPQPAANGFLALLEMESLAGDYNQDGIITFRDFEIWKLHLGTSHAAADGNGNGVVDAGDYTIWRDAFAAAGEFGSTMSVPEPAGLGLLAVAMIGLAFARRVLPQR